MAEKTYELVVVGAGPGGYVAAIRAAQHLKTPSSVACIERDRLGGTCLNWGCIPTKALIRSAELMRDIQHAEQFGITVGSVSFDPSKIVDRSRGIADTFNRNIGALFRKNKIDAVMGQAQVTEPGRIRVTRSDGSSEQIGYKRLVIAAGCKPRELGFARFNGTTIISSKEALQLRTPPGRMVIIGAGAIGIEFAYYYSAFGTEVTVIEMQESILPIEDHEVSAELKTCFEGYGVKCLTSTMTKAVEPQPGGGVKVTYETADKKAGEIVADVCLVAVGVVADVDGLFTGTAKPVIEKAHIKVDKQFRTTMDGVWAIGDCIGPPWLAHVASHEAVNCIEQMFDLTDEPLDYSTIPGCTYCEPQVASIGLTERKAREQGIKFRVAKIPFKHNGKSQASGHTVGFMKLLFGEPYGELVGAHIIGHNASELIAELGLARQMEATYETIRDTIHAHPTMAEMAMEAAQLPGGWVIHG